MRHAQGHSHRLAFELPTKKGTVLIECQVSEEPSKSKVGACKYCSSKVGRIVCKRQTLELIGVVADVYTSSQAKFVPLIQAILHPIANQ